jgi:hypothetical protein
MYCQHCGQRSDNNLRFCGACGKPFSGTSPIVAPAPTPAPPRQSLESNVRILGILWGIYSAFRLLLGVWTLAVGHFMLPMVFRFVPRDAAPFALGQLLHVIFLFAFVYAAAEGTLGIVTAWGVLTHAPWARTLSLITAFISVISIPFGTAIGIYTLIVFLPSAAEHGYKQLSTPA